MELIVKDPQTICIVGCPLSTFWCSDCRGVLSGNITGKSQNRRYTGNWLILTVVSYSFSSRVCPAEGRLNVQLDLVVWLVSKMAGIKSLFPGSLMPYACDVITTNVTSSKILVLSSPFLKRWKAIAIFSFAYRRMRFLLLGRSVGLKKKKTKNKTKQNNTRSLGIVGPGTPGRKKMYNILWRMFMFLFLFFSMLLLCSFFRLKELFQVKNGVTTSLLFFF